MPTNFFNFLGVVLVTFVLSPGPALCQTEGKPPVIGFGISPMSITLSVSPGRQTTGKLTIAAIGSRIRRRYAIDVSDLGQQESGAIRAVPPGRGARSCAGWITVPKEVEVPPDSRHDVSLTVRCPPGARGAYYALLTVGQSEERPERQMAIGVRPRLSVKLEVIVPGHALAHLETEELTYDAGRGGALPCLRLKVRNTGEWKAAIEGDVLVYDRPGQFPVRASIPYRPNGTSFEVYPGMALPLRCPLSRRLEPGMHRLSVRLRLTGKVQARKDFHLEVPGQTSGTAGITARAGQKSELDVDLSVEPELIEVGIPPGGRRTLSIRVQNQDTRTAHIRVDVAQARMESDGMFTYLDPSQSEAPGWLSISPETFDLAPKRSTAIRVQAAIPRSASGAGPLIGVVRLQADAPAAEFHADWSSGGEFPVLILIQDPMMPPSSLETISFEVVRPGPEKNPSAIVLRVKNSGGRTARAYGGMLLERTNGQEIARMDIGATQPELILPGMEREFRMPLPPLDKGKFRVRAEIAPGGKGGKTAQAEEVFTTEAVIPEGLKGP